MGNLDFSSSSSSHIHQLVAWEQCLGDSMMKEDRLHHKLNESMQVYFRLGYGDVSPIQLAQGCCVGEELQKRQSFSDQLGLTKNGVKLGKDYILKEDDMEVLLGYAR